MKRLFRALGWLAILLILCAVNAPRAWGQAQITNPEVLASNVGGIETGTENTQFIFRANIVPSDPAQFVILWARVYIDPVDPANPEFGAGTAAINMVFNGATGQYVAYIPGYLMGVGPHTWSIVSQEGPGATGGVLMNGTGAAPKPAANLRVVPNANPNDYELMPMTPNYLPDKRVNPGQLGGGLEVLPFDSTSPQDGGSSHFYTWRLRVRTPGGVPLQMPIRRVNYEWRDVRFDPPPNNPAFDLLNQYNSPVILVLVDPAGVRHFCPMEFDPDAPGGNNGFSFGSVYTTDTRLPTSIAHPTGNAAWTNPGAYFRYRLLPVQYQFNWGPLRGEGPYTAFGGPTQPDLLPAIPLGMQMANEVIGRPFTNQYVAFAGPDRATPQGNFSPPFPYYTNTAGRSGQWRYYYMATADLRPPRRPGFPSNGDITRYPGSTSSPADSYGADPDGYIYVYESDNGLGVSSPATPYQHPMVTPILSDGGWTDDLPENGWANGTGGPTHRSRPTTKTRVRFQVRVTKADNNPLPASAVRVYIDGVGYQMQKLVRAGNDDFIQGIVYYYDTQFSQGKEGQHFIYFLVDDGVHKAIWPRRDTPNQGTGDARYFDPQAALPSYGAIYPNSVEFGTNTVGKNYLNEPLVNHRPVLTNPSINPASGSYGTRFTYEVLYTDADNDAPLDADVVIDGRPHRMTRAPEDAGNTYAQGVRYRFEMTLNRTPDDKHTYYFRFRDNWNRLGDYLVSPLRREFGEWQTLPSGDDNGNPAFEITGPTIIGNRSPELTEASYFASDQANTPATLYDFIVKYKDEDNNAPTSLKLYISANQGQTWNAGIDMVPAENSTNYVAGVFFHLSQRIKLPVGGPYWFRFQASDGVQTVDTTLVHVGTRGTAITDGTAHELKLIGGSTTVYGDPNNTNNLNSTKRWYNDPSTIYLWRFNGSTYTRLNYGSDFMVDFANGLVTLAQPTNDKIFASYFYEVTVGPQVVANTAPLLTVPDPGNSATNEGTLSPLQGSPTTTFNYSIIYKDPDNQPPTYVNLVIDSNTTIAMTMDAATPNPPNYANGVKYNASTQLQVGVHNYHFEASDGVDVGRYPAAGANPPELRGPTVTDPTNLVNPLIQHSRGQIDTTTGTQTPKSTSVDNYTFTVTFRNPQGNAPPQGGIVVRLRNQVTGNEITAGLNPIDPIGPNEFMAGVRYQVQLNRNTSPALTPGTYDVTFGFSSDPLSGTAPLILIVNGRPVLSSPSATPNPASQAGDVTLSVTYSDVNGDPPSSIKLFVDGVEYTAVTPTTVPANPTTSEFRTGVLYQWTLQAKNLSVGDHKYYFTARDDLEDSNPPAVPAPPGNTVTINAAKTPLLLVPSADSANNNGTLTPLTGSTTQTYTYTVKYRHGDGVLPSTIDVTLDEGTAQERVVALTPANGTTPTEAEIKAGVLYSVALNDLASGKHTYRFKATDRLAPAAGHTATLPTMTSNPFQGPTVNFPPVLSSGTVYEFGSTTPPTVDAQNQLNPAQKGNVLTKWVFEVTYTDPDGAPPAGGYVRVTINNSQVLTLVPKAGQPLNYRNGVVYTTIGGKDSGGNTLPSTGLTLSAGQKVFHFDAFDTLDSARFPTAAGSEIGGLTVANIPVLEKINPSGLDDGTLSPRAGPLSTVFTYKVRYKNADNTAPVYVKVFIDGTAYDMVKTTPTDTNYAAGVEYQYQHRFASGTNHKYYFEAADSVSVGYTARYPATGDLNGPTVNVPTFDPATFNPTEPKLGEPVTIRSRLVVGTGTSIGDFIAIKLIRPDGTGVNDRAATDPATGEFSYTFVPTQTGDWKVQFSWGGSQGTYDPLSTEFAFKVTMPALFVGPYLDMISIPLIPVTPSPELTLAPTSPTGTPVSVTELNLIKWVLNGLGGGQYSALNVDGNFPGMTGGQSYWIRPNSGLNINPKGRLWDQTQPYEIPLQTGWNMIGSVYLQDINWSAVKVRVGGSLVALTDPSSPVRPVAWTYNVGTGAYDAVSGNGVLKPYRGYWVRATAPATLVLNIPGARSATITRDVLDRTTSIQVGVRSGDRVEADNFTPATGMDKSRLALVEKPPYVENYVTVRFVPAENVSLPASTRAAAANQTVVTFDVETDRKNSDVTVFFPNASQIGRKTEGTLVDLSTGTSRAISTSSGVTYNTGDNARPRRFALLIQSVKGPERLVISALQAKSRGLGTFSINYNVSVAATMRASIVGLSGNTVRDLDKSRSVTRGVNALVWDGKDNRGVSVPAGPYTLKLTGTDEKGNAATAIIQIVVTR